MSTKKSTSAAKTKKTAARPAPTHPSWIDMIKECIAASPDESRQGVSRPHIKKFVEEQYHLQIGTAQNTQLARAIATGAEKGIFVLPKGPAGKVKLPPKNARPVDTSASKENKPAKAAASKPVTKGRPVKTASTRATAVKATPAKKAAAKARAVAVTKASAAKKAAEKKAEATKASRSAATKAAPSKPPLSKPPKKVLAGKKVAPAKKTTAPSKRGAVKKAVTGTSAPAKARAAATKKAPTSKKAAAGKRAPTKRSSAKTS